MQKHTVRIAALAAIVAFLSATAAPLHAQATRPDETKAAKLPGCMNAFAIDLYKELAAGEKGNVFYSPFSVSTALAMTQTGARGDTAAQMAKVLHLEKLDKAPEQFKELIAQLNGEGRKDRPYQLTAVNAIWGQKGYPFKKDFVDGVATSFGGAMFDVDFATETEKARTAINKWVEQKTNSKIKDLIGEGVLTTDTRLVLTNAIYFKSDWAHKFDATNTRKRDFAVSKDKKVQADMMWQSEHLGYCKDDSAAVLSVPYKDDELSMLVVLPKDAEGLAKVEKELSAGQIDKWVAALKDKKVDVLLPKFKVEFEASLKDPLKKLGMVDAFSRDKADFTGMTAEDELYISHVLHKAYVSVNEAGTEAAAATAVIMALKLEDAEVVEFHADRPFLFVIRETKTGAVLFIGRLMNP